MCTNIEKINSRIVICEFRLDIGYVLELDTRESSAADK